MTEGRWLGAVADDVRLLDRTSTAQRVADVLRERITAGDLPPRTRLPEEQLIEVLRVSRNTLREAFRLLTHEGLLEHELHRGVFVRELGEDDLVDLYRLRRLIECNVVAGLAGLDPGRMERLADDVETASAAAARGDWVAVGTANMRFHAGLVGLAGSPRTNQVVAHLLAEVRLAFHAAASPRRLHEPYVERNRSLLALLVEGRYDVAARELDRYLDDSLAELLAAMREGPSLERPDTGDAADETDAVAETVAAP
ncbi:GntR family transcriptional regulator [Nocardioides terrisoli]|uniref:GntR family transcriptional regulator n=1 Tax=Nocardioides terrisoli TaxID=3388267 RepID=UPI00287BA54B|nr:GntR family transcriptional regulator [Nocardioides marmorisolisilvae]